MSDVPPMRCCRDIHGWNFLRWTLRLSHDVLFACTLITSEMLLRHCASWKYHLLLNRGFKLTRDCSKMSRLSDVFRSAAIYQEWHITWTSNIHHKINAWLYKPKTLYKSARSKRGLSYWSTILRKLHSKSLEQGISHFVRSRNNFVLWCSEHECHYFTNQFVPEVPSLLLQFIWAHSHPRNSEMAAGGRLVIGLCSSRCEKPSSILFSDFYQDKDCLEALEILRFQSLLL